jgi:hypothetical protein
MVSASYASMAVPPQGVDTINREMTSERIGMRHNCGCLLEFPDRPDAELPAENKRGMMAGQAPQEGLRKQSGVEGADQRRARRMREAEARGHRQRSCP